MRRRYFDLCVSTSSETMLMFEKTPVAQSSACSTIASSCRCIGYFRKPFCSRVVIDYCDVMTLVSPFAWFGQIHRRPVYDCVQERRVARKHSDCSNAPRNPQQFDLCVLASSSCRDYARIDLWPALGTCPPDGSTYTSGTCPPDGSTYTSGTCPPDGSTYTSGTCPPDGSTYSFTSSTRTSVE